MTYDSTASAVSEPPAPASLPAPLAAGPPAVVRFLVGASAFKSALAAAPHARAKHLQLRHFDTRAAALARAGIALHLRTQNKRHFLTFEAADGAIEVLTQTAEPDLEKLGPDTAARLNALLDGEPLAPAFTIDIKRTLQTITTPATEILAAFDTGAIQAGGQAQPIREVTLTLKSGDPAELYRAAAELAAAQPVRLGVQTQAARGALLVSGAPPAPAKSPPGLEANITLDAAIGSFITSCIDQFTGNFPAFEAGDGERAIHQMRVAMRRLRAIIGLFNRAFPNAEFQAARAQARAIAATLGQARDWDVFITLVNNGPLKMFPAEAGFEPLMADAEAKRAAGYAAVRALLASAETTRFVLTLHAFAARNAWRNTLQSEALPLLAEPAATFAAQNLARLHRKLARRGKNVAALSPHDRHELRKDLKKLRYTADLFGTLFNNAGQIKTYIRGAAALQDELGTYNDLAGALTHAARLDTSAGPHASRAAGIIMGWCGHDAAADDTGLAERWKKFRKRSLF